MTPFEVLSLAFGSVGTIGIPFTIYLLTRQARRRDEHYGEISQKLGHLDNCIDDLKTRVLSNTVTRGDLAALTSDLQAALSRQRQEIGNDTGGLERRIYRLEDHMLRASS